MYFGYVSRSNNLFIRAQKNVVEKKIPINANCEIVLMNKKKKNNYKLELVLKWTSKQSLKVVFDTEYDRGYLAQVCYK